MDVDQKPGIRRDICGLGLFRSVMVPHPSPLGRVVNTDELRQIPFRGFTGRTHEDRIAE